MPNCSSFQTRGDLSTEKGSDQGKFCPRIVVITMQSIKLILSHTLCIGKIFKESPQHIQRTYMFNFFYEDPTQLLFVLAIGGVIRFIFIFRTLRIF